MEKEGTSPLRLEAIPDELVMSRIREIRGQKVVLDADLAQFYGTETSLLKRQVRRNIDRFPEDFMFELTEKEVENLRCQSGISSWGGNRYLPMVFTEQGVTMLLGDHCQIDKIILTTLLHLASISFAFLSISFGSSFLILLISSALNSK